MELGPEIEPAAITQNVNRKFVPKLTIFFKVALKSSRGCVVPWQQRVARSNVDHRSSLL